MNNNLDENNVNPIMKQSVRCGEIMPEIIYLEEKWWPLEGKIRLTIKAQALNFQARFCCVLHTYV